MKKKLMIVGLALSFCLVACGDQPDNDVTTESVSTEAASRGRTTEATTELDTETAMLEEDVTVQDDLARIEEKYSKVVSELDENMNQQEMNAHFERRFEVWETEMNRIWESLSDENKQALINEQDDWTKLRDGNSYVAGLAAVGGSSQASLTYQYEAIMTRKRTYALAKYLADERGEEFAIPENIKAELDEKMPSLDEVFKSFEGEWKIDKTEDGTFTFVLSSVDLENYVENSTWTFIESDGLTLTDLDVYGYAEDNIVFEFSNEGATQYYWFRLNSEDNSISLHKYTSLKDPYAKGAIIGRK